MNITNETLIRQKSVRTRANEDDPVQTSCTVSFDFSNCTPEFIMDLAVSSAVIVWQRKNRGSLGALGATTDCDVSQLYGKTPVDPLTAATAGLSRMADEKKMEFLKAELAKMTDEKAKK